MECDLGFRGGKVIYKMFDDIGPKIWTLHQDRMSVIRNQCQICYIMNRPLQKFASIFLANQ